MYTALALLSILFLFAACEPSNNGRFPQPIFQQVNQEQFQPEELLAYQYSEKGEHTCTTGRKVFETVRDLCMGIQDDNKNNNCAAGERQNRFSHQCEGDLGLKWHESVQCDLAVLKGERDLDGDPVNDEVISKQTFCAGRKRSNNWGLSTIAQEGELYKGIKFYINLNYRKDSDLLYKVQIKTLRADGQDETDDTFHSDGMNIYEGQLFDEDARMRFSCYPVASCQN